MITSDDVTKVQQEHPARRASDSPHSFKPIDGFRTCGVCGLKETHKVHREETSVN